MNIIFLIICIAIILLIAFAATSRADDPIFAYLLGNVNPTIYVTLNGTSVYWDYINNVTSPCPAGQYVNGIYSNMTFICAVDSGGSGSDTNCSLNGSCLNVVYFANTTAWDKNTSDDFNGSWGALYGVPAGFADGVDNDTDTTYTAGSNLSLTGTTFSLNSTALKAWLDTVYESISTAFSGSFNDLYDVPTGLADGDNDTTYTCSDWLSCGFSGSGINYWQVSGDWMSPNTSAGGKNNINVTKINASDWSNVTIGEYQISDLGAYITDGNTGWDNSYGLIANGSDANHTTISMTTPSSVKFRLSGATISAWLTNTYPIIFTTTGDDSYPFGFSNRGTLIIQGQTTTGSPRDIVFATGDTTPTYRMNIASSGNVGIGVNSPLHKLHVVGDIYSTTNISAGEAFCIDTDCTSQLLNWSDVDNGTFQYDIGTDCAASNYAYGAYDNGTLKCREDQNTGTGSGTPSPWTNDTAQISIAPTYPGYVNISNTVFINQTTGFMGVGITNNQSDGVKLHINGTDSTRFRLTTETVGVAISARDFLGGYGVFGTFTNHPFIIVANDSETMSISANGRVLIGAYHADYNATQILDVNGSINVSLPTGEIYVGNSLLCRADGTHCGGNTTTQMLAAVNGTALNLSRSWGYPETDSAHDTCAEISGCVVGALTAESDPKWTANQSSYMNNATLFNQFYNKTNIDTQGEVEAIWGVALSTDSEVTAANASLNAWIYGNYILANGSKALTANWDAGAFNITSNGVHVGDNEYVVYGTDNDVFEYFNGTCKITKIGARKYALC